MDKSEGSSKKRSPAGASRRAYSLFGGIINLTQSSHTPKSNATSGNAAAAAPSRTTPDPQGSSNVYTVTVNNNHNVDCNTNQQQAMQQSYENIGPMKKKRGDQSPSAVSSFTNSGGMSSSSGGGTGSSGPIGPAPRTLSILTALNELAISDEIAGANPAISTRPPLPPTLSGRVSGGVGPGNSNTSKSNPSHSSCHHSKGSSRSSQLSSSNTHHGGGSQVQYEIPTTPGGASSSSASLHHSPSSIYYPSSRSSAKGMYSSPGGGGGGATGPNARAKGYNEPHRNPISPASSSSSAAANTLPSTLRAGNKSLAEHKESLARRGAGKQRDRSKSRTPDWIWKIFQLTKHGKLEELKQSLLGLDSTLIRHLADAKGNTVLHTAARGGHVNTLQWLVSVLGPQCTEAALHDHNQVGRTVILTALKKGQLPVLQWLVHHTKTGEKALVPNEGERSLLHFAATSGDINVVRWLCTELIEKGIPVDIRDAGGMTPLHDAAKSGHIIVCHELILAGADPLSQTELGWRPSDLAIRHRHMECASYFMVAEAAGSLGNQLHSLLLAFNHLRQEHEELRSHFRETLRVGKWLAKERNDVIKHFPSKWTQETTSSVLLGGTTNGTRFADLEHKLVVAEQAWKKFSQNDEPGEALLNGDSTSTTSNITSQDFLQRLAAVQLRAERNTSLGSSLSGSSDEEDQHDNSSSDDDASSGELELDRVPPLPAGSGLGVNSAAIIHSATTVSPAQQQQHQQQLRKNNTMMMMMKTRSKAAPWLLPPNDVFLSQLSPFVGASGKSLPTLDLLHGAPTSASASSSSLLSPIVTPPPSSSLSSVPTAAVPTPSSQQPASTTDTAGKNEKSLVTIDGERHGGNQGKRDSTSLEISVLEVIEPGSPASPSSSKKKREDGVEQFQLSSRPWLDFSDQTKGMLRSLPKCGMTKPPPPPPFGIGGEESGGSGGGGVGVGRKSGGLVVKPSSSAVELGGDHLAVSEQSSSRLVGSRQGDRDGSGVTRGGQQCDEYDLDRVTSYSSPTPVPTTSQQKKHHHHHRESENVHQTPDLICGTQYRSHLESRWRLQQTPSSRKGHQSSPSSSSDYYSPSERNLMERAEGIYGGLSARCQRGGTKGGQQVSSDPQIEPPFITSTEAELGDKGEAVRCGEGEMLLLQGHPPCHSPSSFPPSKSSDNEKGPCGGGANEAVSDSGNAGGFAGGSSSPSCASVPGGGNNNNNTSTNELTLSGPGPSHGYNGHKPRSPSPKSYVTKLTVIPVEATSETCFLSIRSTSFSGDNEIEEQPVVPHQLQLPGDNPDELGLPCQIPSDSVSSSNTPVMPRFSSSGSVLFPQRKPDWYSTELCSLPTPECSLAGRHSPTPSETSRTESALAPPPSYVSHASQNSEASKTESARGQEGGEDGGGERDLESPGAEEEARYNNDDAGASCDCHHSPILGSEKGSGCGDDEEPQSEQQQPGHDGTSFEMCAGGSKSADGYPRRNNKKGDDDDDGGGGDNDGSGLKPVGMFANQRIHARSCFVRSHLSTGIHKTSAQRLPKGHRGQSKPWYEIDGSDDEGSLLRVAKSRQSHHSSRFSSSSSSSRGSSRNSNTEEEEDDDVDGSEHESERNNSSGHEEEEKEEDSDSQPQKQHHSNHNCSNFL